MVSILIFVYSKTIKKGNMKKMMLAIAILLGSYTASTAQAVKTPPKQTTVKQMPAAAAKTVQKPAEQTAATIKKVPAAATQAAANTKQTAVKTSNATTAPVKAAAATTTSKATATKAVVTTNANVVLKKDGTPDKRYKEAQQLKKDGTPDMRYKKNK